MNIGSVLTETAARSPDVAALIAGDVRRSYAEFNERANRLASALEQLGVGRGDRVAILQRNGAELLETLFATFKAGAVTVPIGSRLHHKEYRYIIEDSGARVVVFTAEFAAGLDGVRAEIGGGVEHFVCIGGGADWAEDYEELLARGDAAHVDVDTAPDDVCWLFYTSGTTGRPKGAMVTHANLAFMTEHYPREVYRLQPDDVVLHAGPLTHGGGLWAVPVTAGGGTHLISTSPSFSPEHIFQLIQRQRVTKIAFIAPTMITMLLNAPTIDQYDLSSLRFIGYGGSTMYVEDLKRALHRFGPIFCQIYGQGESPMTIAMLSREQHAEALRSENEHRLASAGTPRADIELAVLDAQDRPLPPDEIGEIALRGDVVMKGYLNKPDATEEAFRNGWYHTGDLGKIDRDGYVYLLDRLKEMIITGGANVYPREVEEVLLLHPAVLEVAVVGVPDRLWGESVLAAVRLRPGAHAIEDELLALCRDHLAGYKKPRYIRFLDDLPKNGVGKIMKRALKDRFARELVEAVS